MYTATPMYKYSIEGPVAILPLQRGRRAKYEEELVQFRMDSVPMVIVVTPRDLFFESVFLIARQGYSGLRF